MKTRIPLILPLAAALVLPAMAQQAPADSQQPPPHRRKAVATGFQPDRRFGSELQSTSIQNANSDQNMSARQPLGA